MSKNTFNPNFLEFLICPKSGGKLEYNKKKNILVTKDGKHSYEIENGIPKLVLDQNNNVLSLPGGSKPTYKDGVLLPPVYDQKTFLNPHDVCVDNDDNLYVPQWNSNKTYPVKLTRV